MVYEKENAGTVDNNNIADRNTRTSVTVYNCYDKI